MAIKQRARKEEDKLARREAILETAARMLGRHQFATITMAEIAKRCGLAKGTLYLYFKSKEELFLAALERQLADWFDHIARTLGGAGPQDAESFATIVAQSLTDRETLTDLLTILHTVLERNIEASTALAFKQMLRDKVTMGGKVLEAVLPRLPPGGGAQLLLRVHALVLGFRQMADPTPPIAEILDRDDFAVLRVDFERDLTDTLCDLIRGMERGEPSH